MPVIGWGNPVRSGACLAPQLRVLPSSDPPLLQSAQPPETTETWGSNSPEDIFFHLITNQELAKDMDLVFGDTREPMPSTADRETAQDYVREVGCGTLRLYLQALSIIQPACQLTQATTLQVLKTYVGTTNADLYYFANKRLQDIIGRPEESRSVKGGNTVGSQQPSRASLVLSPLRVVCTRTCVCFG